MDKTTICIILLAVILGVASALLAGFLQGRECSCKRNCDAPAKPRLLT